VAALRFAFEEAAMRQVPLLAVCALADASGVLGGDGGLQDEVESLLGRLEKEHPGRLYIDLKGPSARTCRVLGPAPG
jgi:hypothetical protein